MGPLFGPLRGHGEAIKKEMSRQGAREAGREVNRKMDAWCRKVNKNDVGSDNKQRGWLGSGVFWKFRFTEEILTSCETCLHVCKKSLHN